MFSNLQHVERSSQVLHRMVIFAQASSKYEVDCVCNQVDEDLKYLERKQFKFLNPR